MEKNDQAPVSFSMYHKQFDRNFHTTGYVFRRMDGDTMIFVGISNPSQIHRVKPQQFIAGLYTNSVIGYHWYGLYHQKMSHEEIIAYVRSLIPQPVQNVSNF